MSVNKEVLNALAPLIEAGIPVTAHVHFENVAPYITFAVFYRAYAQNADNDGTVSEHHIQIDLWGHGDLTGLANQVRKLMKNAFFHYVGEGEIYESDTKTFHRHMDFIFIEEDEE